MVTVIGGRNKRESLAAMIAVRAGSRPRLIYRVHAGRALAKTRLKHMQYQPGLVDGFLAGTRLDLTPLCNPRN